MHKLTIAGIGELLWDVLPSGENLGGAPANFAYHVSALGAKGLIISTVGIDERGTRAVELLKSRNLDTSCISITEEYPTGFVTAQLDNKGVATYTFPDRVAWDYLTINRKARERADNLQAICFGTLAQRSEPARQAIRDFLKGLPDKALRVYDLNLRQHFYSKETIDVSLQHSSILKLNDEELDILSRLFNLSGTTRERLQALLAFYDLKLIILTRGSRGSILQSSSEISEHPGVESETIDTIGAGDSFTAAATLGLLLEKSLDEINEHANRLAAYVCSQAGAMPQVPEHFSLCP